LVDSTKKHPDLVAARHSGKQGSHFRKISISRFPEHSGLMLSQRG